MISVLSSSPIVLDFVDQPAHVPVGILREAGENFHLARVQFLFGVAERIPGRVRIGSGRQLGVRRDDAEFLLALEGPLAVLIPAVVELALVFVSPLLRDMMRRMGGAGGVIDEPRLVGVVRADGVQPLDGLVGDVVREVVELPVFALGDAENRVVLGDDRIVLAGGAGQEPPPVVEAPGLRPVLEGAGRPHLAARRHVPLAEAAGDVAVLLQDAGQRSATPRPCAGVAGERSRKLGDAAHAHAVMVAPGEQRRPGRRAHRRHVEGVVGQAHLPRSAPASVCGSRRRKVPDRRTRRHRRGRSAHWARFREPSGRG